MKSPSTFDRVLTALHAIHSLWTVGEWMLTALKVGRWLVVGAAAIWVMLF